jgi:hypothetical protein
MTNDEPARLVFGYIRAEEPDEIEIGLLRKEMAAYCEVNDYRLATVCCDRGSDGSEFSRPGFTVALDVLALPTSYALLVPALAHLSPQEVIREGLIRLVRRTGAQLFVIHAPNGAHQAGAS